MMTKAITILTQLYDRTMTLKCPNCDKYALTNVGKKKWVCWSCLYSEER